MLIPSGMLCKIIVIARVIPNFIFAVADKKVIIPSGILCNIIVITSIIPVLYKLLLIFLLIFLLIVFAIIIPTFKNINRNMILGIFLKSLLKSVNDSLKSSKRLVLRRTPLVNDRVILISFSLFILIYIGIIPSNVALPERNVKSIA